MNILSNTNEGSDRYIAHRSGRVEAYSYFQMKEYMEDECSTNDIEMIDSSNDDNNHEQAYNALLKSEILEIKENMSYGIESKEVESCQSSFTSFLNYSKFKKCEEKKFGHKGVGNENSNISTKKTRQIAKTPFKVLDAPALKDDYYLNLLDWSCQNVLAVGLAHHIYLWSGNTGKVVKMTDLGSLNSVTSLGWASSGNHISVGTHKGTVEIWDVNKCKLVRNFEGHQHRVGALAFGDS